MALLKNVYILEPSFNSADQLRLNEGNYILSKIDLGSANQNLETLDLEVGSKFVSSSIGYREIKLEGYVAPEDFTEASMSECKNTLQRHLSLFQKVTFSFYIESSDFIPIYWVDCYPTSTITWGTSSEDNNKYVCKYSVTLRALDPYAHCPIQYNNNVGRVVIPTATEYTYMDVAEIYNQYIRFNNIGSNPKLPIRFNHTFASPVSIKKIVIYSDTTGDANMLTYDLGTTSTVQRIEFDSQAMTCTYYMGSAHIDISNKATIESSQPFLPTGLSVNQFYYVDASNNNQYFQPLLTNPVDFTEV